MSPVSAILILCVLAVILIFNMRFASLEKRVFVLRRIDAKIDLLLKHAGIEYDPYKNLPEGVVRALQRGEKISAIKSYREATGVGLKEAKDFVEEVQRQTGTAG